MIQVKYPTPNFKLKEEDGKEWIFDSIRKQWVRLTPEEWVRQNFVQYLVVQKKYPASLIAIEKEIKIGELRRRFDIVVYKNTLPWMIIECKEMETPLNGAVLQQVLQYNIALAGSYIALINGQEHYLWLLQDGEAIIQQSFPDFL